MKARPQGDLLAHIRQRGKFPSSTARYCTSDHKRGQVRVVMTRLVREFTDSLSTEERCVRALAKRPVRILSCMGFRREESPARAKKDEFRHDPKASNGKLPADVGALLVGLAPHEAVPVLGQVLDHERHVDEWCPILDWTVDQVLDNTCGAATTLVAARAEGRRAIGIELHDDFVDMAAARLASGSEGDRWT